jgi:hypothetical protein
MLGYQLDGFRALGLFHVTTVVDNLEELADFYKRVFGVPSRTREHSRSRGSGTPR